LVRQLAKRRIHRADKGRPFRLEARRSSKDTSRNRLGCRSAGFRGRRATVRRSLVAAAPSAVAFVPQPCAHCKFGRLFAFLALQAGQAVTMLLHSVRPPRERGIAWS
jgi:hypothetical protein